jgi:acylphosphatase
MFQREPLRCSTGRDVGFRYALADDARALGLRGWVRNFRNGDVEAIVTAAAQNIEAMVAWAQKGPAAATVIAVRVDPTTNEIRRIRDLPDELVYSKLEAVEKALAQHAAPDCHVDLSGSTWIVSASNPG